jgi:hypothetical protein
MTLKANKIGLIFVELARKARLEIIVGRIYEHVTRVSAKDVLNDGFKCKFI